MNDFSRGMLYLLKGVNALFTKGLKRFILLPLLFNFILFSGLFYVIYHYLFPYSVEAINQLPAWLHFLQSIFFIIFFISFFLLSLSVFTVIFSVIAAPFYGLLAEKAQALLFKSTTPAVSFATVAWRSIKRQGQFLLYYFPRFFGMCVLFFVPFIQPIYPFLWFAFNAWMLSIQCQDFVMDNNLIDFKPMKDKLQQKKWVTLGFGSMINFGCAIPILNILTIPAAVIGSVILYKNEMNKHAKKVIVR